MKVTRQQAYLIWYTPLPEKVIESIGRTCYKSEDKITEDSAGKFVKRMVDSGHHAMIEHASASFRIITDRGISHEIVRHRLASYAQESTRYCNYTKDKFGREITVIRPPGMPDNSSIRDRWLRACWAAEDEYFGLINAGIAPEIARNVLPTCLKTELVMTTNFREWRHFINLRGSKPAHPQIRQIARLILEQLKAIAPNVFYDLEVYEETT